MISKLTKIIFLMIAIIFFQPAFALLSMELTQGISGALPISVVPFATKGNPPNHDVSAIIANDLQNCGRFKLYSASALPSYPSNFNEVKFDFFKSLGVDDIVIGKVQPIGNGKFQVSFQLLEILRSKEENRKKSPLLLTHHFVAQEKDLRALAHHISDMIYEKLTGIRGVFSTKIAYVLVQRSSEDGPAKYTLEVSDQDGYNPKPLLISPDPIMSPAWSPNGKQIAYVSFEKTRSSIFIEDVATGTRRIISQFPGINGAPAWSPDGKKLALVLSKSGSPNIYIMDLATQQLSQLTNDWYINTEPAWSPDGKMLIFTSNRSGNNPQIYQLNPITKEVSRISFDGDYNARPSFAPGGKYISMLHRSSGVFNIGLLDLDTGVLNVLTHSGSNSESPSMAPNGSMILFGTEYQGRNVLAMASTDARVQVRLPARNGEVQDPAWSPFLTNFSLNH